MFLLALVLVAFGAIPAEAGSFTLFGPQHYRRTTGPPDKFSNSFTAPTIPTQYTLRVFNGGPPGPSIPVASDPVSSAIVKLNGVQIFGPSDFHDRVEVLETAVSLKASNDLSVELRSKPDSGITIMVVGIDNTAPNITGSQAPAANANGWNNAGVIVTFTCSDDLSGVASCPALVTVNTEGANQQVSGMATDRAGNTAATTVTVNIDKTMPSISAAGTPAANANGWNTAAVTVAFTCSDVVSGIATCPSPVTVSAEGGNQPVSGTAIDKAGNSASVNTTVNIDKTSPTITASAAPPPNSNGWNSTNVTVTFSCSDALSGILSCPPAVNLASEGQNQIASGTAVDKAGNTANASATVNIDKTPPVISISSPVNGGVVSNAVMTVTGTVSDALSGVASVLCNSNINASVSGTAFSCTVTLTEGSNTINVQAQDVAGNSATAGVTVTLNTRPTITAAASPSPNAGGWNNTNVVVTFTCTKPSGTIASCTPPVTVSTDGAKQVITGTATDSTGNSATTSVTLNVDKTPPTLVVASPANNATVPASTITFIGTVSDALSGLSTVTCNNASATLSSGNFSCEVALSAGANVITVQATDVAGNVATQPLTINQFVPPPTGPIAVSWINVVCATTNGNGLKKSGSNSAWDCGAASKQVIEDGYGFVEFTASETNLYRMAGLSSRYNSPNYTVIDYAIFLRNDGTINIYEAGNSITPVQPYHSGDRFRVEVRYGVVRYLQNGTVFYTSTAVPAFPLRAVTSLYSPNATVTDVRLGDFVWTDAVGATISGESLKKTDVDGWNAGAISTKTMESGDGYLEFSATETNTTRAAGLANNRTGQNNTDIAFGFQLHNDSSLEIIESGTSRGAFGSYLGGDRFRVEVVGGVVRYYRNGVQLYTSTVTPVYPLRADAVLYTAGATLTDATIEPLVWASTTGVVIQGPTLTKTVADGWNAGASSTNTIVSSDGWMEFTALETNTRRAGGLKANGPAQSYSDIDFAIDLGASGVIQVFELGASRGQFGAYANGDRLRVEIQDGIVRYRKNGVVFYTSNVAPVYPLHAEVSLFSQGATLFDVAMGDLVWFNDVGVRIFGNNLAKNISTSAWDAGVESTKRINSGYVEFTATQTTTNRIAGLTNGITIPNFVSVDFGIFFLTDSTFQVCENGTCRGTFGSFVPGDRFRVEVAGSVVRYRKNGVVFYTSTVAPNLPLRVDAAMYQPNSSLFNLKLVGDAVIDPAPAPSITPGTNTYTNTVSVTITDSLPLATIRYTLDGTDPGENSAVYTGAVTISQTTTVKAKAWKSNYTPSSISTAVYTLKVASLTFNPGAGTYNTMQNVAIATAVAGATIRYTVDGADPTPTSAVYSSPITVDQTMTLKARATKTGWTDSDVATATFSMQVGALTLSPAPGSYNGVQSVSVTTATPNVTVRYTLDGSQPTSLSAAVTGNTIAIGHSTVLQVQGFRTGWYASNIVSGNYFLNLGTVATPTFNPAPGTYTTAQNVTISSATAGATIRYTTDGTEPNIRSRVYSGPFAVFATTELRAKAFASDMTASATAAGVYVIDSGNVDTPRFSPGSGTYPTYQTVTVTTQTTGATIHYTTNGADPTEADPVVVSGSTVTVGQSITLKAKAWKTGTPPSDVARAAYLITGAIAVGGSGDYALALRPDGTLWSWGTNNDAQLGREPRNTISPTPAQMAIADVIAIAAGNQHGLALKRDGTVWAWGDGFLGRLGNNSWNVQWAPVPVTGLTDVISISAGGYHSMAVKRDGTVWIWGRDSDTGIDYGSVPVQKAGLTGVTQVASKDNSSFALKTDGEQSGTVWAWGGNYYGNLGDGTFSNRATPVRVVGLTDVTMVAASNAHTIAARSDGSVWTWGNNCCGQLGSVNIDGRTVPAPAAIPSPGRVSSIAAGGGFSLAVERPQTGVSTTWAWGSDGNCRLGDGTANTTNTPVRNLVNDAVLVAAGGATGLAISSDGRLWAWGDNSSGQLGDGTTGGRCSPIVVPAFSSSNASPLNDDPDGDGLPTWLELEIGTDPWNADTNGDGIPDGVSRRIGISPTNLDHDGDGLTNAQEIAIGTDPFRADTDGDGVNDKLDCFPLDAARSQCPAPVPGDTTPPAINLKEPTNAVLTGSTP